MGNEQFYQKLAQDAEIKWKDIFSECRRKHSREELEYALLAGTTLNSATEANMLQKWRKPWVFYPLLKAGAALIVLVYGLLFVNLNMIGNVTSGFLLMMTAIPPFVMPVIIMIFIWELNIPRNLSIYELFGFFLAGGLLSFLGTSVMFDFVQSGPAKLAAFREEPAKLAAALLILYFFSKKKKVYGLTGLVIGAAVGAGFGSFESITYAQSAGGIQDIVGNQILRGIYALGGHTLMSAPYAAAVALEMKDSRLSWNCIWNKDFLVTFGSSVLLHYIWNSDLSDFGIRNPSGTLALCKNIIVIIFFWIELLYMARKCLRQVVLIGSGSRGKGGSAGSRKAAATGAGSRKVAAAGAGSIRGECTGGAIRGAVWQSEGADILMIGRDPDLGFHIPGKAGGVSRRHCCIRKTSQGWILRDMDSTYGTFINGSQKLMPNVDYTLHSGDMIYLAGKENAFRVSIK